MKKKTSSIKFVARFKCHLPERLPHTLLLQMIPGSFQAPLHHLPFALGVDLSIITILIFWTISIITIHMPWTISTITICMSWTISKTTDMMD